MSIQNFLIEMYRILFLKKYHILSSEELERRNKKLCDRGKFVSLEQLQSRRTRNLNSNSFRG